MSGAEASSSMHEVPLDPSHMTLSPSSKSVPCSRSHSASSSSSSSMHNNSARFEASLKMKAALARVADNHISNTALSIPDSSASVRSPVRASTVHGNRAASVGAPSPNGRIRAQSSIQGGASSRSARVSPQLRAAVPHPHNPVPLLPAAAMMASGSTAYAGSHSSGPQWNRHTAELSDSIVAYLSPLLPTEEEYRIKEATRRQLERLANRVSPGSKLLAFGSMANGFALRNSDLDLCCLTADHAPTTAQKAQLVETLGQLIRQETDFTVMPLPKARIPIIKINRSSTSQLPYEISCDIGFENRLALENTRLLLSYAMIDPQRLRTLVLFVKLWAKRRKLNSPYTGTLSSYGYTLLVLYFLVHVKQPAVLPNLQRIPPTRPMRADEVQLEGNDIYFYDDVAALRKDWSSQNTDNVGELLIDFFRYFSKHFGYSRDVVSLKSDTGLLAKDGLVWSSELCIQDPFSQDYNVSRTVTKDGLYTIRGEFMRATRILTNMSRGTKLSACIAELCEEREDSLTRAPDRPSPTTQRYQHSSSRERYSPPRRFDASTGGYGGSFAFEQMARGLGQGIAFPPTAAMLAPLSRTQGLNSETGYMSYGHASARTSPSMQHASPSAYRTLDGVLDTPSPRNKTSRSFSETLNRSRSPTHHHVYGQPNGQSQGYTAPTPPAFYDPVASMAGLSVTSAPARRLSGSSVASSCAQYDSTTSSSALHYSSASSPWSMGSHPESHATADTLALVHEYLRRSTFPCTEHDYDPDDSISEGTLDELARLSECEDSPASPTIQARHKALAATGKDR